MSLPQVMDYFTALPHRHIYIARYIYTNGMVRGRLSYLHVPLPKASWPYVKVSTRKTSLMDHLGYRPVTSTPDDVQFIFPQEQVWRTLPAKQLTSGTLAEEPEYVRDLVATIVSHERRLAIEDFLLIGSRRFSNAQSTSDIDLVFRPDHKIDALATSFAKLRTAGTVKKVPFERDVRFHSRFAHVDCSMTELALINEAQWFRKCIFCDRATFSIGFSTEDRSFHYPIRDTGRLIEFCGLVKEAHNSYTPPYEYVVEDIHSGSQWTIHTYLWAFQKCAREGDHVRVRGKLCTDGSSQFVYVNARTDYMLPTLREPININSE